MEGTEKWVPAPRRPYETLSESAMKVEGATKEKFEAYRDQVRKLVETCDYHLVLSKLLDEKPEDFDEEKSKAYDDHINKSEGFEAPDTQSGGGLEFGGIFKMVISKERRFQDFDFCAELAVKKYNTYFKGTEFGELEYVKVLTVNGQISCIMTFYITLEAKDLADRAKVKTYQTKVLMRPPRGPNPWSVLSFRLKPGPDDEQGSGKRQAEWFWKEKYPLE